MAGNVARRKADLLGTRLVTSRLRYSAPPQVQQPGRIHQHFFCTRIARVSSNLNIGLVWVRVDAAGGASLDSDSVCLLGLLQP